MIALSLSRDRISNMKIQIGLPKKCPVVQPSPRGQAGIMVCTAVPVCDEAQGPCVCSVVCFAANHVWVHCLAAVRCCTDIHGQCYRWGPHYCLCHCLRPCWCLSVAELWPRVMMVSMAMLWWRAMLMSMIPVAPETGQRSSGVCWCWRSCECSYCQKACRSPGSVLSVTVEETEATFAVVLMTIDTLLIREGHRRLLWQILSPP